MLPPIEKPYGLWENPCTIASIYEQPVSPMYPFRFEGDLYWLQGLPEEKGRIVLMTEVDGEARCLTPTPFNIRTAVHEYGGKCFCLHDDQFVFNNFSDGRIYRQSLREGSDPVAVTSENTSCVGFADLVSLSPYGFVLSVMEYKDETGAHVNSLAGVSVFDSESQPQVIVCGSDFYACPQVNQDCSQIVWVQWDQPNMPWDESALFVASIANQDAGITISNEKPLIDLPRTSVCHPGFLSDDSIVFAMDSDECHWWSLFRWHKNQLTQLTNVNSSEEVMEFGEAHWVFGQSRWVQVDDQTIFALATNHHGDRLLRLSIENDHHNLEILHEASLGQLTYHQGKCQLMMFPQNEPWVLVEIDAENLITSPLLSSGFIGNETYSKAVTIQCATRDNEETHGYYYPPCNQAFVAPEGAKPPLIVMVHGGPTSRTNASYHPLRQFFTGLGFAVFDINHRGSTGHGRKYRQRLLGGWGEVDVTDIADSVAYLIGKNLANPNAIFIRGGSAGGYTVLRSLTCFADLFAAGACYYGIGNLITLCEITHKFEGKYTDMLVGEPFSPETARQADSLYVQRSPIFDMDKLTAPLILFQGVEDKVVPKEVSREVVEVLKRKGIDYGYTEYEGEGHGFRQTKTKIDALEKETAFYTKILQPL